MKKTFQIILFILKITFCGFGGGNAMVPIIRKEAVEKRKWLTSAEFDHLIVTTNMIPGPSVVECLTFIAIKQLGKIKGTIVAFFAILPHLIFALFIFILMERYIDPRYIHAINLGVMPVIIGVLISFSVSYFKSSKKELKMPWLILIITITILFVLLIPSPYNIPVFIMIAIIIIVLVVKTIQDKKMNNKKEEKL